MEVRRGDELAKWPALLRQNRRNQVFLVAWDSPLPVPEDARGMMKDIAMTSTDYIWFLGASDPEMFAIENMLRAAKQEVRYAVSQSGIRVTASKSYEACTPFVPLRKSIVRVECDFKDKSPSILIDHHRDGDPGFGMPHDLFLQASSIGQVLRLLISMRIEGLENFISDITAKLPPCFNGPEEPTFLYVKSSEFKTLAEGWYIFHRSSGWLVSNALVLTAAADHCLAAAYAGECPGVSRDTLFSWRTNSRAMHQGRPVADILRDVENSSVALKIAPRLQLGDGISIADMRADQPWPELQDAAAMLGVGYMAGPFTSPAEPRRKYTCSGTEREVAAWMESAASRFGLESLYGDPTRGFAGGYLPKEE